MSNNLPDLVTIAEAAKILNVSTKTLRRWEAKGKITPERTFGGHRRFVTRRLEEVAETIKNAKKLAYKKAFLYSKVKVPTQVPVSVIRNREWLFVNEIPTFYKALHVEQKRILVTFLMLFVGVGLTAFSVRVAPAGTKAKVLSFFHLATSYQLLTTGSGSSGAVLQAAAGTPSFNVNVEANFEGDVNIRGNLVLPGSLALPGDLGVGGGDLTTTAATFNLADTNTTTLNIGGEATTVSLGAATGTTTVNNNLVASGTLDINGNLAKVNGVSYSWPTSQGSATTYLKNNGSGTLTWASISTAADLTNVTGVLGVASGGTGASSAFTAGSVLFSNGTAFAQDNANFFWDDTNNILKIGSGGKLTPTVNIGADLGSSSFKWNNLYVANINSDSALTLSGQGIFTYDPADTTYAEASIRINPTAPATNEQMLGIGQGGEERTAIDAEGDLTVGYDGTAGSSVPATSNPFNVYNHGTTAITTIDTTGNLAIAGVLAGTSGTNTRLQATGTGTGPTGTGSIYFLDSSGTTRGRFATVPGEVSVDTNFGTGADGAITISSAKNINTQALISERNYADGIAYRVTAPTDNATSVTRYSSSDLLTNGLAVNDEVLLINLQGTSSDNADVGNYEYKRIKNISTNTITFTTAITKSFDGTTASNQKVVIQRIPQYTSITLSGSGSLTASAWEGLVTTPTGAAGYLTGIVAFRATGTVSVGSGTSITVTGKGYRGGASVGGNVAGNQGESSGGTGSVSCNANVAAGGGGGAGIPGQVAGPGGGGGGHSATGSNGTRENGFACLGVGGSSISAAALTTLFHGGAGGSGGGHQNGSSGAGGIAGGIIFIAANTITVTSTGTISANATNGGNGTGEYNGGGGGGSGGSIFIASANPTLGTNLVTSAAGGGGSPSNPGNGTGGSGSTGRIRIEYTGTLSGTTSPAASEATSISAGVQAPSSSTVYGTLYAGGINTSDADLAEYYVSGDKSVEAGDVVSLSDTLLFDDNSQEITNKGVMRKATTPYDSKLLGIVSTKPGVILGSIDGETGKEDQRMLALSGRVPVKIDPESEPILIGDFLTSSDKPGLAKKATKAGYTVGKALEAWSCQSSDVSHQTTDQPESGRLTADGCPQTIEVFVNLGYYFGPLTADGYIDTQASFVANDIRINLPGASPAPVLSASDSATATDSASPATSYLLPATDTVSLAETISSILGKLETVEGDISLLKTASISSSQSLSNSLTSLTVLGQTLLSDTVISGKLNVGTTEIGSDGSIQSLGKLKLQPLAIEGIEFLGGYIEMDKNGNLNITKGVLTGNPLIRDSVTISPGQVSVRASASGGWDKTPVSVQVTPSYKTQVWVTGISAAGFTINVSDSPTEPQKLYWWAVW